MFLTLILILLLIFIFLRLLFSPILRFFFRRAEFNPQRKQNVAYRKGETTIISHENQQSEVPKDFGDYTDYEEVKNENTR